MIHFTLAQSKLAVIQEAGQVGQSGIEWSGVLLRCKRARPSETSGSRGVGVAVRSVKAGDEGE